jgi:hypothetical protein
VNTELFAEGELRICFAPPDDARALDAASLPKLDVSRLPGAEVVSRVAFEAPSVRAGGGCARGSSGRFVPGIEGVLFEKATWFALQGAELAPDLLEVRTTETIAGVTRQSLRGRRGDDTVAIEHLLGFAGPDSDVVLCSTVCVGDAAICEAASRIELEGTPAPPPAPGLLLRSAIAAVEHPYEATFGLGVAALLLVALVLAKRPRDP